MLLASEVPSGNERPIDDGPPQSDVPTPARNLERMLRAAFKSAFNSNPQDLHLKTD